MKICSSCGFKVLDNQKFCPKCGLPVDSKMLENASKEIISDSEKQKSEKQESEKQSNLNIPDNKKKKHINKSIIMITIIAITIIVLVSSEDEYSKLKDIITYVKNEFASIMKIENIVFIKFDESNNRYLFESSYEDSQEQYYYYPETGEITITVPGSEVIINQNFSFKTTFGGEPSDEDYDWRSYLLERIPYEEVLKVNESIDNIAKNKFSDMLDYAISPYLECQIDGIELYLVRVNEGEPNYEVYEFLLGSDGKIYDYWEDEYSKLKDIITYVKNEFANIMKSENIVFIKFDESNNRYLFESSYEESEEQYYYYPETDEITINIPGAEAIINQNFSFKTTFWGEPSDEDYYWQSYLWERTSYEEVVKVNEAIDNIAKNMFSDKLDYAISPYLECEIEGIELYLVRVNEGEPDYEVNEFLLGSNGITYDYWEAISGNRLVQIF